MLNHLLRYEPVLAALAEDPPADVLEVGSGSRGIARYLPERVPVTAADITFDDYGSDSVGAAGRVTRVTASVLDLPFAGGAFDAVVALDLLEHLAPADRPRAVAELRRVARRTLIVGCPTGEPALEADRRLAAYARRLRRPAPAWLDEHLANGFPEPEDLPEWTGGGRVVANESVRSHTVVCALEATPALWTAPLALARVLQPLATRPGGRRILRRLRGGDGPVAYRTIVIAPSRPAR